MKKRIGEIFEWRRDCGSACRFLGIDESK